MRERRLAIDHTTIYRWVQRYAPELEKRCRSHLKVTTDSWRVDETYVKIKGVWMYLSRAVDSQGNTLEFLLSATRDTQAAKRFFEKALGASHTVTPRVITVDKNAGFCQNSNNILASQPYFCSADRIKTGFKKECWPMNCPHCAAIGSKKRMKKTKRGYLTFFCPQCRSTFNERTGTPFNSLDFPTDIVLLAVVWRLRSKLIFVRTASWEKRSPSPNDDELSSIDLSPCKHCYK